MKNGIACSVFVLMGFFAVACHAQDESEECLQAIDMWYQLEGDSVEDLTEQNCRFVISYTRDPSTYNCTWGDPDYAKPSLEFLSNAWEGLCELAGHFPFDDQDISATQAGVEITDIPPITQGSATPNRPIDGGNGANCEGVSNGQFLPAVPQPIDSYLGIVSTAYSAYSAIIAATNLVESHQQAVQTGDSSELFDNVYTMLWSAVVPLGDAIGMREIFADFSQFTDDLAVAASNC